MKAYFALLLSLLVSACWQVGESHPTVEARVGIVYDGDSFLVKRGRNELEIRLYGIDAPEQQQAWSAEAKNALSKLIMGEMLRIEIVERDRYDRTIARAYRVRDNLYINAEMIARGHAWVYRRYTDDRALYRLEKKARQSRVSLWGLPAELRVPPWEWRQSKENRND